MVFRCTFDDGRRLNREWVAFMLEFWIGHGRRPGGWKERVEFIV